MDITKQDLIDDYINVARFVVENYQQHLEAGDTSSQEYWFAKSCLIGIGISESAPDPIMHNSETLLIDTWGWIDPSVREQMKQNNHPLALAVQEFET